MRMQMYVPMRWATKWDPTPGSLTWEKFQRRLTGITGNITVLNGTGHWNGGSGYKVDPVLVVETFIDKGCSLLGCHTYSDVWALMREYAQQLLANGAESVLVVQDNEPTFIR